MARLEQFRRPPELQCMLQSLASRLAPSGAVEVKIFREKWRIGRGPVACGISIRNHRGMSALQSLDEVRIGKAYFAGDLGLEGDCTTFAKILVTFWLRSAVPIETRRNPDAGPGAKHSK